MAGAADSTFTVTTVDALNCRSSKAVARTAIGPGPVSVVSSVAWLRLEESLPPLATYVIFTGLLSGLTASQLIEALSPARRLVGEAEQLIFGGTVFVLAASGCGALVKDGLMGGRTGASLTSITSTPSPTCIASNAVKTIAVAVLCCTLSTIMSPTVRRGRLETSPCGSLCGSFWVSS